MNQGILKSLGGEAQTEPQRPQLSSRLSQRTSGLRDLSTRF